MVEMEAIDLEEKITPYNWVLVDLKEYESKFSSLEKVFFVKTIENLSYLGILKKNKAIIELNYDYDKFKLRNEYETLKMLAGNNVLRFIKYRIELTNLGNDFWRCCFRP